ncbi:MAG: phosphoglucosamine mutase [Candidatus Hadarchaeales archaeon]
MGRLFGTSGIRGVFGHDITPEMFIEIGKSLATFIGGGEVIVARDPRLSGEILANALMAGIMGGGCQVLDGGIAPTPALAFSVRILRKKAGAAITASHNPPEYNGAKFWDERGMAYTVEMEREIERIYFEKSWKGVEWKFVGKSRKIDVCRTYIQEILKNLQLERKFRVVVDCGNGAGSVVTPFLLRKLGCEVIGLNCHLDGRFPGRGLEPNEENLTVLCRIVKEVKADLGIAHDGDADRVAVVDDHGRFVGGDKLVAMLASWIVKSKGTVVTTVDASMIVDEAVKKAGGRVVRTKVGDVSVACEVAKYGAKFGGEPSGAMIFPDLHLAPDGPLGAIKVLMMLEEIGRPLSELADELPEFPIARKKIACPNEIKEKVMREVSEELPRMLETISLTTVDGIRVETEDGWVLVRPSGTEPYIRITAEGRSPEVTKMLVEKASKVVEKII